MKYKETLELQENVKIMNEAYDIYNDFMKNISVLLSNYQGNNKFLLWKDSHNSKYIVVHDKRLEYVCDFLHEQYSIMLTKDKIFDAIKANYRGVEHLKADSMRIKE